MSVFRTTGLIPHLLCWTLSAVLILPPTAAVAGRDDDDEEEDDEDRPRRRSGDDDDDDDDRRRRSRDDDEGGDRRKRSSDDDDDDDSDRRKRSGDDDDDRRKRSSDDDRRKRSGDDDDDDDDRGPKDSLPIQGLLSKDESSGQQIERRVLRDGIRDGENYRFLSGLWVLRAPSVEAWEDRIAPELAGVEESNQPIDELRAALGRLDAAVIAGPDVSGAVVTFDLPGDRGDGVVAFVPPAVVGPEGSVLSHREANKVRVVSGVAVHETNSKPVLLSIGAKSTPDAYTGGEVRLPTLTTLEDEGEGAWVKFRGRSMTSGDEMAKAMSAVGKFAERESLSVESMQVWPGESGDKEGLKDNLQTLKVETRVLERRSKDDKPDILDTLKDDPDEWEWGEKRLKHPIRYGIFTLPVAAEVEAGKSGAEERAEIFAFVVTYTPAFIAFDEAPLYMGTSPEFFAKAVRGGQVPFFQDGGDILFYTGDLDRFVAGQALEAEGKALSRKNVPETIERWLEGEDGKDLKSIEGVARNSAHWPMRFVEKDDGVTARVTTADYVGWLRRFKRSFKPEGTKPLDGTWVLEWGGEAAVVDLGVALKGGTVEVTKAEPVAKVDTKPRGETEDVRIRETAALSDKEKAKLAEQQKADEDARKKAEAKRAEDEKQREAQRLAEQQKREEEERRRQEAEAKAKEPVDIKVRAVTLGTPAAGKPYLAVQPGTTLPLTVEFGAEGNVAGHQVQVVAQGLDRNGKELTDFVVRGTKAAPKAGDNKVQLSLRVPPNWTKAEQKGLYKVVTRVEVDGVPLRGSREDLVMVGAPLALRKVELDPSVVVPGDEVLLLIDLEVGGWPGEEEVKLQADLTWAVGSFKKTDNIPMTRGNGSHALELDVRAPSDVPPGDGTWSLALSSAGAYKTTLTGPIKVLAAEVVEQGAATSSAARVRFDEDESEDEVAAAAAKAGAEGKSTERQTVRRSSAGGDDPFEDEEDIDLDAMEEEPKKQSKGGQSQSKSSSQSSSGKGGDSKGKAGASSTSSGSSGKSEGKKAPPPEEDEDEPKQKPAAKSEGKKAPPPEEDEDEPKQKPAAKSEGKKAPPPEEDEDEPKQKPAAKSEGKKAPPPEEDEDEPKQKPAAKSEGKKAPPPEEDEEPKQKPAAKSEGKKAPPPEEDEDEPKKKPAAKSEGKKAPPPEEDDEDASDETSKAPPVSEDEALMPEDYPDFIYYEEDEDEVLMQAEADALGVVRLYGSAEGRLKTWLAELTAAQKEGAPQWLWIVYGSKGPGKLTFSRYSTKAGAWVKVWEMPDRLSTREEEAAAKKQLREIFLGLVPDQKKRVSFDKF